MNTQQYYEGFKIRLPVKDQGFCSYPSIIIGKKHIYLHIYVWEKKFGNTPKGHQIHHKDGDRMNYNLDNLELLTISQHQRLHAGWVRDKNNDWIKKPCKKCNRILDINSFYIKRTRKTINNICKDCCQINNRKWWDSNKEVVNKNRRKK